MIHLAPRNGDDLPGFWRILLTQNIRIPSHKTQRTRALPHRPDGTFFHPHTALSSSYFCGPAPDYAAVPRQAPPPFGTIHRFISLTSFSSIDSPLTAQKQWGVLYV